MFLFFNILYLFLYRTHVGLYKAIMLRQKDILKGQSDFNEYYEECLYKLTDLDYFCTRN